MIVPGLLTGAECDRLIAATSELLESLNAPAAKKIGGVRNILRDGAAVGALSRSETILGLVHAHLPAAFPVRGILFDKNLRANWRVPWHQDLTIAVQEKLPTPGFGPWSVKAGVPHVQPPVAVLERMLAIRLHLDDCTADNGALRVIPGSHRCGELTSEQIVELQKARSAVVCEVPRGGALLMRPLLLHASSPASQPEHRRVLHIEYAGESLPNGLTWFEQ